MLTPVSLFATGFFYNRSMKTTAELIKKYNRPAPRYTSYPPVPYWESMPAESEWINQVLASYKPESGIDLYVHVPYCEKLCYYCGCNRTITKDHSVEGSYLELIQREWQIYKEKFGFSPVINSLHFGGGTPTFLSPANLEKLITTLTQNRSESFIGSIEIDPRTCSTGHLEVLKKTGIQRVSLGIQDFDLGVQEAINRIQPVSMVRLLVKKIRESGIKSINFDLVYGLPLQTKETISNTIAEVITMRPDLIAFYSYAHLPDRIKNQKLIQEKTLPSPEAKRELYETGKGLLLKAGYIDVGMDHFALPESYLSVAKTNNALHRNFMGYVDKKAGILIGLGPTSISDSGMSFVQNAKDMSDYETSIRKGKLPLEKGHVHSEIDLLIQETILKLMCQGHVDLNTNLPYFDEVLKELNDFKEDGLVTVNQKELRLTETGTAFMRNVAMTFDYRLREKTLNVKFSQVI